MKISIAICTWNRCDLLRSTLEQCTRLIVPENLLFEIVVINNNCTDSTDAVIAEFQDRLPIVRIFESMPGKAHALNRCLREVTGDYVLWTDDDVRVESHWLEEFAAAADRYPLAAVFGGPIEPWFGVEPDPDLVEAFPVLRVGFCGVDHGPTEGLLPADRFIWGANMGYRLGFDRDLTFAPDLGPSPASYMGGEDRRFQQQIREKDGNIIWCPRMKVKHYVDPARMSLDYLLRFTEAKGTEHVLAETDPREVSRSGAPLWLWRERMVTHVQRRLGDMTRLPPRLPAKLRCRRGLPKTASKRVRRLVWTAEDVFLRGMVAGYRQIAETRGAVHDAERRRSM